jgi:hypothetical protein
VKRTKDVKKITKRDNELDRRENWERIKYNGRRLEEERVLSSIWIGVGHFCLTISSAVLL